MHRELIVLHERHYMGIILNMVYRVMIKYGHYAPDSGPSATTANLKRLHRL